MNKAKIANWKSIELKQAKCRGSRITTNITLTKFIAENMRTPNYVCESKLTPFQVNQNAHRIICDL